MKWLLAVVGLVNSQSAQLWLFRCLHSAPPRRKCGATGRVTPSVHQISTHRPTWLTTTLTVTCTIRDYSTRRATVYKLLCQVEHFEGSIQTLGFLFRLWTRRFLYQRTWGLKILCWQNKQYHIAATTPTTFHNQGNFVELSFWLHSHRAAFEYKHSLI